ncbi:maternal embryonic leucine zipper kinase-like [Macrosteles quadrilineatus]|uniref:maternal embryonic leucine zipper kinase-like n=1 Tax=Macrosteles quadrilineatus TaxID=74068 RepID=UPI0023E1C22C|nr:maternal embryonic leucine zipper kinase-like [Macrosteles quadrilineatus]
MAAYYRVSGEELWTQLQERQFDWYSATYQLLLARKKLGLPLQLSLPPSARTRLQSMRRAVVGGDINPKGTFVKLPKTEKTPEKTEKENESNMMLPPERTRSRVLRKRQRSITREPSASPIPKKVAATEITPNEGFQTPKKSNRSTPSTPVNRVSSPSSRLLNSIERKLQHVRKALTPKKQQSNDCILPTLLTSKNMSNISTTSSSSPDYVREELVKALNSKGIECHCKGYSIRGKVQSEGKVCKLSFELEICLIPTTANVSGSVVGVRRKRLKGDAWCYKRVCEEVLLLANLQ